MIKKLTYILFILLIVQCKKETKQEEYNSDTETTTATINQEELNYVLNDSFPIGDVRRYGLKIGGGDPKHPYTGEITTTSIFKMASKERIELFFPKGFYNFGIYFKGIKDIKVNFDHAEFAGPIYIIEGEDKSPSSDIYLKGDVTTYYKFFTRNSSDIIVNNITIKTDEEKNISKLRSMGCDIYSGTKNISFNTITIEDLGSGKDSYKLTRAAMQVHGWNNNPEGLDVNKLHIKSSDSHGLYLTGANHVFKEIIVDRFGIGKDIVINDLEDSDKDQTSKITGVWINRVSDAEIGKITVNTDASKGTYGLWLDQGKAANPTIIYEVNFIGGDKKLPLFADDNTNVIVKKFDK